MGENSTMLDKQPAGWTLIVLLIVVAIIALLMALYLPSVLQMYSPPTTEGEEGTKKPVLESVKERLEGIGQRNKQIDDFMNQQNGSKKEPDDQEQQDDYEE